MKSAIKIKRVFIWLTAIIFLGVFIFFFLTSELFIKVNNKLFCIVYDYENGESVPSSTGVTFGIDVSHHQKKIDWKKVRFWKNKKINFVYIKATEGETYKDSFYSQNILGAKENEITVGSYHYFRTTSTVNAQFNNFIKTVDIKQQDLIPMVDVEEMSNWSESEFHNNFQLFLDKIERYYGCKPVIYTVNRFYNRYLANRYNNYYFMIGRYGNYSPCLRKNGNWMIWQFTEEGKIDGIKGKVDIDVINKKFSLNDLLIRKKMKNKKK